MSGHDLSHIAYRSGRPHDKDKVAVIVSKWNQEITGTLYQGALRVLIEAGVNPDNIITIDVPGSFELPGGANYILNKEKDLDGVICLGCVIQGETRHFDFICDAVSHSIMQLGIDHNKPVIFGVLTPNTMQQALDRAGGKYGNKGEEASVALLEMIDLFKG